MDSRNIACACAAAFIGITLTAASTHALAKDRSPIVVVGQKVDPELQRRVSYADLNLAFRPGQRILDERIYRTAGNLCVDLNGILELDSCTRKAVDSTDEQVASAITRAQRQMAGLPVGPAVAISMVISAE